MNHFIVITGATGNLGSRIIHRVLKNTSYDIVAVLLDFEDAHAFLGKFGDIERRRIRIIFKSEMNKNDLKKADVLLHLAFARRNHTFAEIADSVDYCKTIFTLFAKQEPKRAIYVSSQGIYGNTEKYRREDTEPAPATVYSMAKYAGEKVFEMAFSDTGIETCIVRLDSVIQSQNLVKALCHAAVSDGRMVIQGGEQTFSYIDEEDAADAIFMLSVHEGEISRFYNIGPDHMRVTLRQIAGIIQKQCSEIGRSVEINVTDATGMLWAGMDSSRFMRELHWMPQNDLEMMIRKILSGLLQG